MTKFSKMLSMMLAVILVTVAFAPAAFAVTYAPYNWKSWPNQSENSYKTMLTKAIQRYVNMSLETNITIDGSFGPNTNNKVHAYQGGAKLPADGIVGPKTWEDMQKYLHVFNTSPAGVIAYNIPTMPTREKGDNATFNGISSFLWSPSTSTWSVNANPPSSNVAVWQYISY